MYFIWVNSLTALLSIFWLIKQQHILLYKLNSNSIPDSSSKCFIVFAFSLSFARSYQVANLFNKILWKDETIHYFKSVFTFTPIKNLPENILNKSVFITINVGNPRADVVTTHTFLISLLKEYEATTGESYDYQKDIIYFEKIIFKIENNQLLYRCGEGSSGIEDNILGTVTLI